MTGIDHEVRVSRRALVHKRVRVVSLIEMVRAQSALFGLSVRKALASVRELRCPGDWVGRPSSKAKLPIPIRYPVLVDRDSVSVDMNPRVVSEAGGN